MKHAKTFALVAASAFAVGLAVYLWKNRAALADYTRRRSQNDAIDALSQQLSREFNAAIDIDPPGTT